MASQDLDTAEADMPQDFKKKPGLNNPEEASQFIGDINKAADQFTQTIHKYEPYSIQDTYSDFVGTYFEKLSQIEEYFKDASIQGFLDLVDDTACKIMRVDTEWERKEQELCKDPRISINNIMQPHTVMNQLEALPGFKQFVKGVNNLPMPNSSDIYKGLTMHQLRWLDI